MSFFNVSFFTDVLRLVPWPFYAGVAALVLLPWIGRILFEFYQQYITDTKPK